MRIKKRGLFLILQDVPPILISALETEFSFYAKKYDLFRSKVEVVRQENFAVLEDGSYCIPHGYLERLLTIIDTLRITYTIEDQPYKELKSNWENLSKFTFRYRQEELLRILESRIFANRGGLVVAPPAFGKSYVFSALSCLYDEAKIDIVTKRRDVVLNIYNTLIRYLPRVGLFTSGKRERGRVTVYTAGSLSYSDFLADILILDEVDELITDGFYPKFFSYNTNRVIGCTATPNTRFDGLQERIKGLCGPMIFNADYNEVAKAGSVVPIVVQWLRPPCQPMRLPELIVERKRLGYWENSARNSYIAKVAREFYNSGLQTLILVETVDHAMNIKQFLPEFEVCYAGVKKEGNFPKISQKQRDDLRMKFLSRELMGCIATGVWSTGVSFDGLEVLIRADGLASKTASVQFPGRVSRICPDINKSAGLVVDFWDDFNERTLRSTKARSKVYASNGWVQYGPDGRRL